MNGRERDREGWVGLDSLCEDMGQSSSLQQLNPWTINVRASRYFWINLWSRCFVKLGEQKAGKLLV